MTVLVHEISCVHAHREDGWVASALQGFDPENTILVLNKTDLIPEQLVGTSLGEATQVGTIRAIIVYHIRIPQPAVIYWQLKDDLFSKW